MWRESHQLQYLKTTLPRLSWRVSSSSKERILLIKWDLLSHLNPLSYLVIIKQEMSYIFTPLFRNLPYHDKQQDR